MGPIYGRRPHIQLASHVRFEIQAQKHLIHRAAHAGFAGSADTIVQAFYREVIEGPDARIGQESFLAKTTPDFRWSGELSWRETTSA